jgi:cytochrome c-type biogenesis protein CcmH
MGAAEGALPPGHPSMAGGNPHGGPVGEMPGASAPIDPNARLVGTLVVADAVKSEVKPGDVIFLVARQDDGSDKGTILGVKRFTASGAPIPFVLDGHDAMFPGVQFAGKVLLTARVDKDGDAITKNPGDVVGAVHVEVPAKDIRLVIDTVAK